MRFSPLSPGVGRPCCAPVAATSLPVQEVAIKIYRGVISEREIEMEFVIIGRSTGKFSLPSLYIVFIKEIY